MTQLYPQQAQEDKGNKKTPEESRKSAPLVNQVENKNQHTKQEGYPHRKKSIFNFILKE